MVHAGCVFVAGIHPFRARTSGSFESVRRNACVHWIDLGLYSHPKEFWRNGVRTQVNSKGKILSTGSSEEDRSHDAVSHRTASPTRYRLSYFGPWTMVRLPHARGSSFRVESHQWLRIGGPVALPGAWRYGVSAGTGRFGVSILWLGEIKSLICNFYLSVAVHKIVWAAPSLR